MSVPETGSFGQQLASKTKLRMAHGQAHHVQLQSTTADKEGKGEKQ